MVPAMRVGQVILRVKDVDESVAFWTATVGLTVTTRSGSFAFLDGGSIQLTLNEVDGPLVDESLTEIVFEVEDVREAHAELVERGVPFEVDLRPVTSDGDRRLLAAHFRDPDGHLASVVGWVS
jgi:catechol 2,3-dioxygenase-like lactoylglutathione lyase family enzyme